MRSFLVCMIPLQWILRERNIGHVTNELQNSPNPDFEERKARLEG